MKINEELAALLTGLGASFVGFSDVAGKAGSSFNDMHSAVSIGLRLSDAIIDEIYDKPTFTYFHHYRTVNSLLDQLALRGVLFIQQHGYNAAAVPASQTVNNTSDPYCGIFPHKTAAVMAGLGRIGKNGLFIHDTFGPRVRLATILTDMPVNDRPSTELALSVHDSTGLELTGLPESETKEPSPCFTSPCFTSQEVKQKNRPSVSCSSCSRCVDACPAMALTGNEWREGMPRDELVDAKACSDYMNRNFKHIGRGSVCGICIKVCPAYTAIKK